MVNLKSKLQFKNLLLKNRIVVPPMASQTALPDGQASNNTIAHYKRLAMSGAGLVMVEYSYISISGKSEVNQLGADSDDQIPGLTNIVNIIKESGGVAALQLVHAGAKTSRDLTEGALISPSNIAVPVKGEKLEKPNAANLADIEHLRRSFLDSVARANKAGFKVVEIHAAHGYGINQWISPITNIREDQYGGNWFNRARILFEIVQEIKTKFPTMILSVRLPGQDHMDGGLSQEESLMIRCSNDFFNNDKIKNFIF